MKKILFSIVSVFLLMSCTYDYFEDENNLRIYVPEIKDKSIKDFVIVFHDHSGKHVLSKHYKYPYNSDELVSNGILRFKVLPGDYTVSCFANTVDSLKSLKINANDGPANAAVQMELINGDLYKPSTALRKKLQIGVNAPFLGTPLRIDTIGIGEENIHVGKIEYQFKGLPSSITKIEIYTYNLSTQLTFENIRRQASENDVVYLNFNPKEHISPKGIPSISDFFFPSVPSGAGDYKKLRVYTRFFDSDNNLMGEYSDPLPKTRDEHGNDIEPVLMPQKKLWILFDGFFVTEVKLSEWGDIIDGGITPM